MSATSVAVLACVLAAVALVVATIAILRLRAVSSRFTVLWPDGVQQDATTTLHGYAARVDALDARVTGLTGRVDAVGEHVAAGLRHVSVVRYDAFGDMGGRLSFSAAIVDDAGDGLVITSIYARGESRTYAKGIVDGRSQVTLTPEEQQAIASARAERSDA